MSWARIEARARFLYDEICSEVANRDWRTPPRPWSQFIEKFTTPRRDPKTIGNRIVLNSHIYQANYCIILGAALLYYVLRRPSSVFVVGAIIVGWVYATSPSPLMVNGRRVTRKERFLAFAVLSVLALLLSGVLFSFIRIVGLALSICVTHATMRHTSMRNKVGEIRSHMADRW